MNPISVPSESPCNALGANLLRYDKNQKYLLFDTETCNLNLVWEKNVPWEYAWLVCTQDKILEKHEYLVQWDDIPISPEAALLTGFYQKQPRIAIHGKSPEYVLEKFGKYLYDPQYIVVAHNGLGFDVYIHNIHRKLLGKSPDYSYIKRMIDTNTIARAMKIGATFPKSREHLAAFQYKMYGHKVKGVKTSVKALCEDFGLEYDPAKAHDALYDCERMHGILKQLLYKVEI